MRDVELTCGPATARLSSLGAEARAWRVGGHELLWPGDPKIWNQISPILFPICGWTRDGIRVDGRHYPLGLHGFAAARTFDLAERRADFARFETRDDEATRAVYPFAFLLAVEYRLTADTLAMTIEVVNAGERLMPYACGLHPGFRWPFEGGEAKGSQIRFERDEDPTVPVLAPGGLFSRARRQTPLAGRVLPLDESLFATDALCWLDCNSRSLAFTQADGASIEMDYPGFRHVAFWMRPGGGYLCLEPWTGYGDPEGFSGDLYQKPSMATLEPGGKARHEAVFRYREPTQA